MYVSYAFTVAIIFSVTLVLYFLADDPPDWVYITGIVVLTLLLAPVNYRVSRILYLYMFGGIKFDASQ